MEFSEIAFLLMMAATFGVVARIFKQPLLIGYLFAGILAASFGFIHSSEQLEAFAQIGVTLLLFLLGMELDLADLPSIGKVAVLSGLGQIIFTSVFGYLIALLLGFPSSSSLYIAVALTFSSTIIMVKLLTERKDLRSLHGRIAIGFLLVQDFVAVVLLMFLSSLGGKEGSGGYVFVALKAIVLLAFVYILSKKVIPKIFEKLTGDSQEMMFILSISWALGFAWFVANPMGFTLEIGGFLAGLALSGLPEHLEISSKTKSLRDFFLTVFFLYLGSQLMVGENLLEIFIPAFVFSVFVLVGNPIIVMAILGFLGYKRRTSFIAGLMVAQISEFSFILMAMGASIGQVESSAVSVVILVGVITMTISTYMVLGADKIFEKIKPILLIFERSKTVESATAKETELKNHVVVVGSDRTGTQLVKYFSKKGTQFIVVDFNPEVFSRLTASGVETILGDIDDVDVQEAANLFNARLVISTTSDLHSNLSLITLLKRRSKSVACVVVAYSKADALKLYEKGADYVLVPRFIAGEYIRHLFSTHGVDPEYIKRIGQNHYKRIMFY